MAGDVVDGVKEESSNGSVDGKKDTAFNLHEAFKSELERVSSGARNDPSTSDSQEWYNSLSQSEQAVIDHASRNRRCRIMGSSQT